MSLMAITCKYNVQFKTPKALIMHCCSKPVQRKTHILVPHVAKKLYLSVSPFGIYPVAKNIANLLYCNMLICFRVQC